MSDRTHGKPKQAVTSGVPGGGCLGHRRQPRGAGGSTLFPVMLLMLLFSVVALGAAFVVRVEVLVQDRFRQAADGFYAAEAGLAAALAQLRAVQDWTAVLDGSRTSHLSQGPMSGEHRVDGGSITICCGPGSAADRLAGETAASASPARRGIRWQPFLWTPVAALIPGRRSGLFVVVWVADDEGDGDGNVASDDNGRVIVRSEALHPSGLRRVVEAYVARRPAPAGEGSGSEEAEPAAGNPPGLWLLSWREVR